RSSSARSPPRHPCRTRPSRFRKKSRSKARTSLKSRQPLEPRRRRKSEFRGAPPSREKRPPPRCEGHPPTPPSHAPESLRHRPAGSHVPRHVAGREGLCDLGGGGCGGPRPPLVETGPSGRRQADGRRLREGRQQVKADLGLQTGAREGRGPVGRGPRPAACNSTSATAERI